MKKPKKELTLEERKEKRLHAIRRQDVRKGRTYNPPKIRSVKNGKYDPWRDD